MDSFMPEETAGCRTGLSVELVVANETLFEDLTSGHTPGGGQMIPYNFITRRAFGEFTYGLHRFGEMQVYTSSGAGTWGPPLRVGTDREIVLLTFP